MFNLDTKELINKINTNSLEFWNEFRKLPSDFDLELSYLQAIYVTKTVVPLDCQERCVQIYNKIEDLISYKDLDIAERENLITKALQRKRNVYNFINIKSYNHYLFVNNFDDLPKELAYFINRVSIDVLKNMNFDNILSTGYSFQIEMNYSFESNGYNVKEEPIIFYERRSGQSKMSKNIIAEALFRVVRLRFRNKKRYFNN